MKFPSALRWSAILLVVGLLALWWWQARDTHTQRPPATVRVIKKPSAPAAMAPVTNENPAPPPASDPVPHASAQPALTTGAPAPRVRPSDALLAASRVAVERWSQPDPRGDRERVAILHADHFKYPLVRVVERWSGKNGRLVSRIAMVADHILIAPKAGSDPKVLEERLAAAGFAVRGREPGSFVLVSFADATTDPDELPRRIDALGAWQDVLEFAEPDHLVWPCVEPNDPAYANNKLWGLHNRGGVSGYVAGADISAPEGWDILHDAPNVIVAITDTGIRYEHQDLAPNMWHNPGETPGDGIDNDGNGVIDDVFGYNAVDNNGNPMDDQGHGSHCAGTIGASGSNGTGLCGVAWKVQLMASRFLGAEGGTTSDGIKAINYARRMGANVISASWGGGPYSEALYQAIAACAQANIPFIAAAGNDGVDNDSDQHYPSSYDLSNIVAVAATDATDHLTDFSCYGRNSVDIAAPGWQIFSSFSGGTSDYRFLDGTSMATPHVSGAMALARARFPNDSAEDLIRRLYQSADVLPALENRVATGGRLNLARLLGSTGQIQPNDSFDTPCVFAGDYGTWNGSNTTATREADEDSWSPVPGSRTLWFAWQAGFEGWADFSFRSLSTGLRLVVYRGDTRGNLTVCADTGTAAMSDKSASCRFQTVAGANYRMVAVSDSATGERFSLAFSVTGVNDLISCATPITGPIFDLAGTNRGATAEPFESRRLYLGVGGGRTVWYRWTAPTTGPFSINTEGSGIDTVLGVYTGDPLKPESLTEIAVSDDHDALLTWSDVRFTAVAGTTYYLSIDSYYNASTGAFQLHGIIPGPPQIMTQPTAVEVPLGGRAVFSVGATGTRTLLYQWFHGTEAIPGAWDRSLVVDPVKETDLGGYHVTVRNGFGSCTSATAMLTEKQMPPTIVWTSGNQAVAPSTPVALKVRAQGTAPLTYQWSRDNAPIGGATGDTLTFDSAQVADAGIYTCTVSNALGSAKANLELSVVPSPWDRWEWRRDCVPHAPITELKVIDNRCVAVAGDRLLVSDDGLQWKDVLLPINFIARSVAKNGNNWVCVGYNFGIKALVTRSTDGVNWSAPVTPVGVAVAYGVSDTYLRQVEVFAGIFVGINNTGAMHYSQDGLTWTSASAAFLNGTNGVFSVPGRPATGGGMMLTPRSILGINQTSTTLLRTTDGIHWTEMNIGSTDTLGLIFYVGGNWYVSCNGWYSSSDGASWQKIATKATSGASWSCWVAAVGDNVAMVNPATQTYLWGKVPDLFQDSFTTIFPTRGQNFSAIVAFGNGAVYSTTTGHLGYATAPADLQFSAETVGSLGQVSFLNGEFIACSVDDGNNSSTPSIPLISGDGIHWTPGKVLSTESRGAIVGFLDNRYFPRTSSTTTGIRNGYAPEMMYPMDSTVTGLTGQPFRIADNGTLAMALLSGSTSVARSADRGRTWLVAASPPYTGGSNSASNIRCVDGLWCLTGAAKTPDELYVSWLTRMYTSTDGQTWRETSVNPAQVTKLGSKWFALGQGPGAMELSESTDGMNWSAVSTTGIPTCYPLRLLSFNNCLVVLLYSSQAWGGYRLAYYSADGRNWFQGRLPADVKDMETALGKLVAVTSYGAILETGPVHPGGGAPVIRVDSPATVSSYPQGSWVEIAGSCTDPEGSATVLEYMVDGVTLATQAGGGDYRFRLRVTKTDGHVVRLRAVDASGLVGTNTLLVSATPPTPSNLLDMGEGAAFLPQKSVVEFGGAVYVAGDHSLFRCSDGTTWERVPLPATAGTVYGMAAGNGSLVVQLTDCNILTTRDGINWTLIPKNGSQSPQTPVQFSAGWFTFVYSIIGVSSSSVMRSKDGLQWDYGTTSIYSVEWSTISEDGVILCGGYTAKAQVSTDAGYNWVPLSKLVPGVTGIGSAAYGKGRFVYLEAGCSWWSTDGTHWTTGASVPNVRWVRFQAGRFFAGDLTNYLMTSADGLSWQALQGATLGTDSNDVEYAVGVFASRGAWSQDAVTWQKADAGPQGSISNRLIGRAAGFLLVDANGALWDSPDGKVWNKRMPGMITPTTPSGTKITALGGRIIVGGTAGMLCYSDDQCATWSNATLDGARVPSTYGCIRLNNINSSVFAMVSSWTGNKLIKSTDGASWTTVALPIDPKTQAIRDIAGDGATLIAVGTGSMVLRSDDGGTIWTAVIIPGIVKGAAVTRLGDSWVVLGTDAPWYGSPLKAFRSSDGNTWSSGVATGVKDGSYAYLKHQYAHGRFVIWGDYDKSYYTTDGSTWAAMTVPSVANVDLVATPTGWLCVQSAGANTALMWTAPPAADVWTSIPTVEYWITSTDNLGSDVYFFGTGFIKRWSQCDLDFELASAPAATLGVGDALNISAIVSNLGGEAVTTALSVDGWLSPDGFFGDGNDIYLGRVPLGIAVPAPGGEATANLSFVMPDTIRPGDMRLIIKLDPEGKVYEYNLSNNISVSKGAMVTIPQWQLNVVTNGNGSVSASQVGEYYPHKARVSFMARAGKGARFAGWGGDALGSLSESMVVLDSNKTVVGNFVATTNLVAYVRGGGTVSSDAEGGAYVTGTTASLHAVALPGWTFSGWSGDLTGTAAAATLAMDTNKIITATFTLTREAWTAREFSAADLTNPLVSGPDADPDGDGMANWREWLRGSSPKDAASRGYSNVTREGRWLLLTYTRLETMPAGYAVRCVAATDLANWTLSVVERVVASTAGVETIEARLDTTGLPQAFIRTVDEGPATTDPYETWRAGAFSAADLPLSNISGRAADPDIDGAPNWREWLSGSLPQDRTSTGLLGMRRDGSAAVLTFTRRSGLPVGYVVRAACTTNLTDWTTVGVVETVISTAAGVDTIEARWTTSSSGYMRVEFRMP